MMFNPLSIYEINLFHDKFHFDIRFQKDLPLLNVSQKEVLLLKED